MFLGCQALPSRFGVWYGRRLSIPALTWSGLVERVTRIELALSAWEASEYGRLSGLTS